MTSHQPLPAPAWTIIIPVKDTGIAKTRLSRFDQAARATLALAFALDTSLAALASPVVRRVLAVTNDAAASRALAALGVVVVADLPAAGLNPALVHGAKVARQWSPGAAVAALTADLPALQPEDLTAAVLAAAGVPHWFVADSARVGTTMLAAGPGEPLSPAFGSHSSAAHREQGAIDLASDGLDRLRRDVDTEEDLRAALGLGVGANTLTALAAVDAATGAREVT